MPFFGLQNSSNLFLKTSSMCPPKVKTMKGSKNGTKTMKTEPSARKSAPISHGRLSYHRRFLQELFYWIQELKTLIQDFDLQLGDSRDDLRRLSELQSELQEFNPKLSFPFLVIRKIFGIEKGRTI
ncbi:hypothetical protein M9H77_30596 [Catharanthus roseus]|uniref:Uncharacterized protein n=1 Tax=Catharanthus roseus TaxID=4058 RepID=A0ACB9ZY17_CATRO|nr:hypothetical protein M9H77_30596 [Catharanthus roseus]